MSFVEDTGGIGTLLAGIRRYFGVLALMVYGKIFLVQIYIRKYLFLGS